MEKKMRTINVRMENDLKSSLEIFCENAGLSLSSLFNVFAKKVVKENKIPFEITGDEMPNKETLQAIQEAELISKNPSLSKTYDNAQEMLDDILGRSNG